MRDHGGHGEGDLAIKYRVREAATRLSVDAFLHGLSRAGWHAPTGRRRREGIEIIRDVAYRETGMSAHRMDVFRREGLEGPAPVVIYIHGGGFAVCSKDTHWSLALPFARRGYVVFNINYRLAPHHKHPAAFHDACAALLWVQRHGHRFGADPSRIAVAGESAGGNLAAGLAVASSYRFEAQPWASAVYEAEHRIRAAIVACAVLQVSDSARFQRRRPQRPDWQRRVLGAMERAYMPAAAQGSTPFADPLLVLEGRAPDRPLPPFFTFVGTRDFLLHDSRRLKAALDRRGVPCDLHIYPDEIHGFHAMPWRPSAHRCWSLQHDFLQRHMLPAAPPEV